LLRRHKNLYHDPNYVAPVPKEKTHECSECNRAFRHKGNLIRHMAIHDPDSSQKIEEPYEGEEETEVLVSYFLFKKIVLFDGL
jgi:Zinc finger, C2H2 type